VETVILKITAKTVAVAESKRKNQIVPLSIKQSNSVNAVNYNSTEYRKLTYV